MRSLVGRALRLVGACLVVPGACLLALGLRIDPDAPHERARR